MNRKHLIIAILNIIITMLMIISNIGHKESRVNWMLDTADVALLFGDI